MDQQRIKQLIDLMADSDLSGMTVSEGGTTVTLSRDAAVSMDVPPRHEIPGAPLDLDVSAPSDRSQETAGSTESAPVSQVCSPLYGVLHLTPSPDEPPFTTLGATVSVGQTLCIVEAMKMFHAVKASRAGCVDAILARAGDEVESGQPLFSIV